MVPDISIVIPHRGDPMGLWATVQSCESDLQDSGLSYEFVIVTNGEPRISRDIVPLLDQLRTNKTLGFQEHFEDPMSPPAARNLGASKASGKTLFFFDNHCLVAPNYFKRAVLDIDHYGMDMLHSTTRYYQGQGDHLHYILTLPYNFWGKSSFLSNHDVRPYQMAMGGHGGFAIRKSVWEEMGGYWEGFVGYGGEEPYFDLKMALLGKSVWIDPKVVHYHYAGERGYARHYTDDFYRNMMMAANIIGGQRWMETVYDSFCKHFKVKMLSQNSMFDLMMQAWDRSKDEASKVSTTRLRTLDEQLDYFRENNVAYS